MPRSRRRLIVLVAALPLVLIAAVGWSVVDDPVVNPKDCNVGGSAPLWWGAGLVIRACLPIVVLAVIPAALVVTRLRTRGRRTWAAAGNGAAAAIVVIGAAVFLSAIARRPDPAPPIPQVDLLALAVSVLVGIAILANAAARAQPDRRTARLVVVPVAVVSIMLLATFVALAVYATDLAVHGVPLTGPITCAQVYPINALPTGYAYWLPTLIVSVMASLAALCCATYATVGAIAGSVRTNPEPDADIVIDLERRFTGWPGGAPGKERYRSWPRCSLTRLTLRVVLDGCGVVLGAVAAVVFGACGADRVRGARAPQRQYRRGGGPARPKCAAQAASGH